MKNRLVSRLAKESNKTFTENGAETYRSTNNAVLDFFYLAPTRQGQDNTDLFLNAFNENPNLAIKCAFYLRDIRGGKGQRNTFRDILLHLYQYDREVFDLIAPYVAQYGRWDDILRFVVSDTVVDLVKSQLVSDINTDRPSLLGKWMPSENVGARGDKSKTVRRLSRLWMKALDLQPSDYRHMLTGLREKIGIVEKQMSAQEWKDINYSHVPSRAMKLYRAAFLRHDENRFTSFIAKAIKGEVKIQSGTLYPHEIAKHFIRGGGQDMALEAMWSQLPDYFDGEERNVMVVVDTSSSMFNSSAGANNKAIEVSVGLGLYCAERNVGAFHNYVMTFNTTPHIVQINGATLKSRIQQVASISWGGSTDIQAVFQTLLQFAEESKARKKDMPETVVIISDMEFNSCSHGTNLAGIEFQYNKSKYRMPKLVFWNVSARGNQVPATKDQNGVFLVSGFSAETIGKVLNAKSTTPEELMLEILNSDRYAFVDSLL